MKANLSSTNIAATANEKPQSSPISIVSSDKSTSPSSSPRSSPRPSPRPQNKREHSKSDTLLTVNYKDQPSPKPEGSPSSQDSVSRLSATEVTPPQITTSSTSGQQQDLKQESLSSSSGRREIKGKKKSWFNSFYPSYKSRSEDFKKLFKKVPDDERLVVDYSCALQKEILVQGRLYVTQNYLCFYANIFGWETNLTLKWKDVAAITKEKTALVIPNAILISTKADKYFFTSFVARDKTYLMLFRVWQNALMDQPMTAQEMWQWVHQCYGTELGLTSDDEDYIPPPIEEDKLSARLSVESFSEQDISGTPDILSDQINNMSSDRGGSNATTAEDGNNVVPPTSFSQRYSGSESNIHTEASEHSESDAEKLDALRRCTEYIHEHRLSDCEDTKADVENVCCTNPHDTRQVINEVIPIHIDQLFILLFTSSKFFLDFHAARKTTDMTQTPWTHNPLDGSKSRVVSLTMYLANSMGPKTCHVTETQTLLPCSKAGQLYSIDIDTVNAGVPYADSFNVCVHYCLRRIDNTHTAFIGFAQIKYKKSVWGLVKGMIERNCYSSMEEYTAHLLRLLKAEEEESVPALKRKSRRKRRLHSMPKLSIEDTRTTIPLRKKISPEGFFTTEVCTMIVFSVLLLLLLLNILLYCKLWSLEDAPPYTLLDLQLLKNPPKNHDEWIRLLQQQETLHTVESQKWQKLLKNAITLLKQAEESLNELQQSIQTTYTSKVISILQNQEEQQLDNQKEL